MNRYLESELEIRSLRLAGAEVGMVRVANHYVDLSLTVPATLSKGDVRIESDCTVAVTRGKSVKLPVGPELGKQLLSFLNLTVLSVDAQALDLILNFTGGRSIQVHALPTGYESYSVTIDDDVAVAIQAFS
jgi:hypothetical protein